MNKPIVPLHDASIVVFASFGRDAQTLAEAITRSGARAQICKRAEEFCTIFDESTVAVLATEETLIAAADTINECVDNQPAWSDVPVIILSGGRGKSGNPARWRFFRRFGNVTVLERPMSAETLTIALEAAHRARSWQYVVRDQMYKLEEQNIDLEQKVRERTQELQVETDERKRIESALNEARRLEAIGRLAGGVAHDFNNLLQVISGASSLLPFAQHDLVRTETLINTIARATERGSKLTQQMLAFGRRQMLSTEALDVVKHIMEMKELLQQSLREKVTLELRLQADLWHAQADVTQLEIALLNLMVNAKDVLPSGGIVTLAARNIRLPAAQISEVADLQGDFIWLSISDNGPGMPPDVVAQAFEPFFTTKRIGEGSGLGLSQVYGFAKQSGGSAWIRTNARGTTVSIVLPRGSKSTPKVDETEERSTKNAARLSGLRVLCVEDDEAVAEVTTALFVAWGCTVDWKRNAVEALQTDLNDYDLVFSDVQMPGSMDGISLAKEIVKNWPDLPVLLASGYAIAPERIRTLHIDLIAKLYNAEQLRRAVLECLS